MTFNSIYNKYMTSENERHALEERLEDATAMTKKLEQQVSDLERRTPGAQKGSVESILREQRDRYKRRVEELEVGEEVRGGVECVGCRASVRERTKRWSRCRQ